MIRLILFGMLAASCRAELDVTSSLVAWTWEVLLERVDRYILPLMPFWYEDLDPYITEPMLTAHHMGEHNVLKSYMNGILQKWRKQEPNNPLAFESILHIMMNLDKVPEPYMSDLRFFGGGFVNHCFYFGILSPNENEEQRVPEGYLLDDINMNFGSLDGLKKQVEEAMNKVRGSGYIWVNRIPGKEGNGSLGITTTANQDSPIIAGLHPIIVIDLWEHAYYLKHNYKRWEHLKDFWMVLDWNYVERLDKWWKNLDEEQKKADERVEALKKSIEEREERLQKEEKKSEL